MGFLAVALAIAVPLFGARAHADYSHTASFISELGATGMPYGSLVSWAGFAPIGLAVLAFLALGAPLLPRTRACAFALACFTSVGVAYAVSALFPCDFGCPAQGSLSQTIHSSFGLFEYVGAFVSLLVFASEFRRDTVWRALVVPSLIAALLVAFGFLAMLSPSLAPLRGASQRVAEAGVFGWIACVSVVFGRSA
jgi:hypothetical protein